MMNQYLQTDLKKFKETHVRSTLLYDGKVIHAYRDDVSLPDGRPAFRELIRHTGAVCVIPVTAEGEVICVRQYRYAVDRLMLEIPAGKLDSGDEDPREAVLRELREETGARCGSLTYLGLYLGSPAILDEKIYMYLAEDLTFGETDPDEDEFIDTVRIPLSELADMVVRGEIADGKTQAAVLRAERMLRDRRQEA